jgi:DNA transposition AAA+ family ATPase
MKHEIVATTNLRALMRSHQAILDRPRGQPGISIVHGPSGYGKTQGLLWLANQSDGIMLEAKSLWTPRWMLADIISELGAQPAHLTQARYEFITATLAANPRPLFIDEADRLASRELLVETLREIHDRTHAPIVLVGMEQFKRRAQSRPQLRRRIVNEVEFKPCTTDDAKLLAKLCEVEIEPGLLTDLHRRTSGSIGLLCNALAAAEATARRTGSKVVKLSDYAQAQ